MSRSPTARTVATMRFRTFALLRALQTLQSGREPDVEGVSLVGKSPSGHLFESLTCGYIVSEIDLRDLNPHTACSTRVEPPRSSARGCTNAAGVCDLGSRCLARLATSVPGRLPIWTELGPTRGRGQARGVSRPFDAPADSGSPAPRARKYMRLPDRRAAPIVFASRSATATRTAWAAAIRSVVGLPKASAGRSGCRWPRPPTGLRRHCG